MKCTHCLNPESIISPSTCCTGCDVLRDKVFTREDQLKCGANFVADGKLYLVRCMCCDNRENWAPAVATGRCTWCGWTENSETPNHEVTEEDKAH